MESDIGGSITPLVTPLAGSAGERVDARALRSLIDFQFEHGSHGVSCTGTTGEPTSLSIEERRQVISIVAEHVAGRGTFLAGTGSNDTAETIRLSTFAQQAGADGLLVVAPYHVRPTQEGLFQHFRAVAAAVDLPIVLYNIPGRAAVNIEPATQKRLRDACPNIIGVKEAYTEYSQVTRALALCGRDWKVFSGIELLCYPMLTVGGAGHVSATANVAPADLAALYELAVESKWDKARELHFRLVDLNEALFVETNPGPVKFLLGEMGLCAPTLRLPLVEPSESSKSYIRKAAAAYGLL